MTREDRLWIMVDVETSGPIIGRHSLLEIGAAVGSVARGEIDRFEVLLTPIGDEVRTSRASYERALREGVAPEIAMAKLAAFAKPYLEKRATFVARPAAFDWPWIVQYAWKYLGENPFGFKAVCASSWFDGRGRRFHVDLPHVAVEDASIQLRHFLESGSHRGAA